MAQNRFYFPERFFRPQNNGNLLAFFSFVDNQTGLEYTNWRLIRGQNGPFVGSPFETYDPGNGEEKKYYNYVRPAYDSGQESKRNPKGDAFLKELTEAAYQMWDGKSNAGGSARGPVAEEDDDLPF